VVEDLVNTYEIDGDEREELFATPADLARWLEERGLVDSGTELTDGDLETAVQFREDLRALLLANNGEPLEESALRRLDDTGGRALLRVRLTGPGGARLDPVAPGIDGALGRVLAIVYGAMAEGTWARLKACRNDECMWVFYDASKNHSATWCSMRVCGNRMKARAYRRRRAEEHA